MDTENVKMGKKGEVGGLLGKGGEYFLTIEILIGYIECSCKQTCSKSAD